METLNDDYGFIYTKVGNNVFHVTNETGFSETWIATKDTTLIEFVGDYVNLPGVVFMQKYKHV